MTESQNKAIKRALLNGETLTPMDALRRWKCFRLAARIRDLRMAGLNIESRMVTNREGKRYAEYSYHLEAK